MCCSRSHTPRTGPLWRSRGIEPESARLVALVSLASWLLRLFTFPLTLLHLADHHHLRIYVPHFLLSQRNHRKIEREHSHRFGYCQRNNNEVFLRVSQKLMAQLPSVNKKTQYGIRDVLGTGSFGKNMVRVRIFRVYALKRDCKYITTPAPGSSHMAARNMARTARTVDPR